MPAPKRPDPNHPLAASAKEFEDDNAALLKTDEPKAPPTLAEPPAVPVVTDPSPAAQPPASQPALAMPPQFQQMMDSMMGRVEALNESNRRLEETLTTQSQNREFLERRANELAQRNAELEARLEAGEATRDFTSDLVDAQHFGEIFRGLQPMFKRLNDTVSSVAAKNAELERRLADAAAAPEVAIGKLRKEILDRTVRRSTPEFSTLLKGDKGFLDFLNERIPGSRRTRMQEVQEAWDQEDDTYFTEVVADFKKRGNLAAVPSPDPQRAITEQTPSAPSKQPIVTDDHIQTAFQHVLDGSMSRADFKKLTAIQNAQAREAVPKR